MREQSIYVKNVCVHNLKGVDLKLRSGQLIVFTGVSGSGKSSLAFDTIHVEGQRRYIASLSTYARRHLGGLTKPAADSIEGLSPTIAIEQKTLARSLRSTVGTLTGIYDFLRVLFARIATAHCPISGEPVKPQSTEKILAAIRRLPSNSRLIFLAPYVKEKKGEFKELFSDLLRKGLMRIRLDGQFVDLSGAISVDKKVAHTIDLVIDRVALKPENHSRIAEATESALELGNGLMSVLDSDRGEEILFSRHAFAKQSQRSYPPLEPRDFSFNHPLGMCPSCEGLGITREFDLKKVIDSEKSIAEDCCSIASSYQTVKWGNIYRNLAQIFHFSIETPWKDLTEKARALFLYGSDQKWLKMEFVHPEKDQHWTEYVRWRGVIYEAKKRLAEAKSAHYHKKMAPLLKETVCPMCSGARIRAYPAAAQIKAKPIAAITAMTIEEAADFFAALNLTGDDAIIGRELVREIKKRLSFLLAVGLDYLTLDRTAPTLSGGEAQRVRLASQLGTGLVGATYVLDEPSIGLHPRDNAKLIATLKALKEKGNTVIVVEHDLEMIHAADHLVDIGPGAGSQGGEIVAEGTVAALTRAKHSLTGAYLAGKEAIAIPTKRRLPSDKALTVVKARHHNLAEITVSFPLGLFIAVTGVSGCGKSSLVTDTVHKTLANQLHQADHTAGACAAIHGIENIQKVIAIDQTPIGRTPRSNPSTYIKLFDAIRDLFAQLPASQIKGYTQGRFSFNVLEGSCPECRGVGMVAIDMDFMDPIWTACSLCHGQRFDPQTLAIRYRRKNIADILAMTVKEAHTFFTNLPAIERKLSFLLRVGLGYLTLGQASTTLSGGEAQRIKLTRELIRPSRGHTVYILDEPTTGLHFHDIRNLIAILQQLVDQGNTVIVIEHNTDLIKTADWIIDLGPEGGKRGGRLIGTGSPEAIAKMETPTGHAVRAALEPKPPKPKRTKKRAAPSSITAIEVEKCSQNNLKDISLSIPRGKISVCTGPSGAGKTSLAFDTVYAEGQRRYVESLSPYARQFVHQMPKPTVAAIDGLAPAIAIEQKKHAGNPRSTVGTITEIYDFLRILYTHLGTAYCPDTGEKIETITKEFVVEQIIKTVATQSRLHILAPIKTSHHLSFETIKDNLLSQGFLRIRLNGTYFELEDDIPFDPKRKNALFLVVDRLVLRPGVEKRLVEAIEQTTRMTKDPFVIATDTEDFLFNLAFAVPSTGKSYPLLTPHTFSFNAEEGMCPFCQGLGFTWGANLLRHAEIMALSPYELMVALWKEEATDVAIDAAVSFFRQSNMNVDTPLYKLPVKQLEMLLNGAPPTQKKQPTFHFAGLNTAFERAAKGNSRAVRESILPLLEETPCIHCETSRLNPLARHVKIGDVSISTLCSWPMSKVQTQVNLWREQESPDSFLIDVFGQICSRLTFLLDIGLHYLALDRSAPTLSGGEMQRIHLARQLGSGLTGCLYVLDEPTIGLHPENNTLLNRALTGLAALGNTLLIVEHEPATIAIADRIFDFGPSAGKQGGTITATGTVAEIKANPRSLTGAYLSGKKQLPVPKKRRPLRSFFRVENATKHNLNNLSLQIPLQALSCVTGMSGSGKSSLVHGVIKKGIELNLAARNQAETIEFEDGRLTGISAIDKLIAIDQSPIGHTIRADVSTYCDISTPLRHFFAALPEAKARGLMPRHFSYNHKSGMCRACHGLGVKTVQLQFLPSVKVACPDCHGQRLGPLSLSVTYRGKTLGQLLNFTVAEAHDALPQIPNLQKKLKTLAAVGLDYVQLGQTVASLSGGEAGRLRLARELSKRSRGHTLYLFDEPTVGLHSEDIGKLIPLFHALVDQKNTVIIIEHNVHLIQNADYMIDLGPGGGEEGGQLIAAGTPEEVTEHPTSYTAHYLRSTFSNPRCV
ncbi:MAG: excinuclease ABC subunit UvrA [Chlamydiota bacterium]